MLSFLFKDLKLYLATFLSTKDLLHLSITEKSNYYTLQDNNLCKYLVARDFNVDVRIKNAVNANWKAAYKSLYIISKERNNPYEKERITFIGNITLQLKKIGLDLYQLKDEIIFFYERLITASNKKSNINISVIDRSFLYEVLCKYSFPNANFSDGKFSKQKYDNLLQEQEKFSRLIANDNKKAINKICKDFHEFVDKIIYLNLLDAEICSSDVENGNILIVAAAKGEIDAVAKLLSLGMDYNATDKNGATALMAAARNGHLEIVKILLEIADININHISNVGCTALIAALIERNNKDNAEEIAEMLLSKGANPHYKNRYGNSVLIIAVKYGRAKIVKLLLNCKMDELTKPTDYLEALDVAEEFQQSKIKYMLQKHIETTFIYYNSSSFYPAHNASASEEPHNSYTSYNALPTPNIPKTPENKL